MRRDDVSQCSGPAGAVEGLTERGDSGDPGTVPKAPANANNDGDGSLVASRVRCRWQG